MKPTQQVQRLQVKFDVFTNMSDLINQIEFETEQRRN